MEGEISKIDIEQLKMLYSETKIHDLKIEKTFEQLLNYHNNMVLEKIRFVSSELATINSKIADEEKELNLLLIKEKELTSKISKNNSFDDLERIITELNEKYRNKGECERMISILDEVDNEIKEISDEINLINDDLFSEDNSLYLKNQVDKFNHIFSSISQELYGESYGLKYDRVNEGGKEIYKFDAFNSNMSSGKKQREILCFNLAYILFSKQEKLESLNFLLNDKKELLHDNQLIKVSRFVEKNNIQLIISILKDKIPDEVLKTSNIVIRLSQKEKLFKI